MDGFSLLDRRWRKKSRVEVCLRRAPAGVPGCVEEQGEVTPGTNPTASGFLPVHSAWREAGELLQLWNGVEPQWGSLLASALVPAPQGALSGSRPPGWLWPGGASVLTGLRCAGQEGHISRAASSSPGLQLELQ